MPTIGAFLVLLTFLLLPLFPGLARAYTHRDSAVRWMEYSNSAFERAKEENKPLFQLISASWCYNCQVYEVALEDTEVAAYLNEHYVPVFVDYDRRPDIARAHTSVGIPVTSIFAPDGELIVSTPGYFTKGELLANLRLTRRYIDEEFLPSEPSSEPEALTPESVEPTAPMLAAYVERFDALYHNALDPAFGGFGTAQKEPHAEVLSRLVALERDREMRWQEPLQQTLRHMLGLEQEAPKRSRPPLETLLALREQQNTALEEVLALQTEDRIVGIYDNVQGGFFRYATRRDWSTPHFEKMLQENAELVDLFLAAHAAYADPAYAEAARHSADYLIATLYDERTGRFYGSQFADEVYYHLTAEERNNIPLPPLDPTSYTGSSARAIVALFNAHETFREERYLTAAKKGLEFLSKRMIGERGAFAYYDPAKGSPILTGRLVDNTRAVQALLRGHRSTGEQRYLAKAEEVLRFLTETLYDAQAGGFYMRRSDRSDLYREEELFNAEKDLDDNGLTAMVLLRAYEATGKEDYLRKAAATLGHFLPLVEGGRFAAASPNFLGGVRLLVGLWEPPDDTPRHPDPAVAEPGWTPKAAGSARLGLVDFGIMLTLCLLAGLLAFLSPCTLPILPAYFAFSFGDSGKTIFRMSIAFFIGLALSFSAMGTTATLLGGLVREYATALVRGGGVLILLFGMAALFGKGFTGPMKDARITRSTVGAFLFGLIFSLGWSSCIGPILGAVLVLAATREGAASGALMLFVFALGLGLPLIVLSLTLQGLDRSRLVWRILRGKAWQVTAAGHTLTLHTSGIISGTLFIALGILMATDQVTYLNRMLPVEIQTWFAGLEEWLIEAVGSPMR